MLEEWRGRVSHELLEFLVDSSGDGHWLMHGGEVN